MSVAVSNNQFVDFQSPDSGTTDRETANRQSTKCDRAKSQCTNRDCAQRYGTNRFRLVARGLKTGKAREFHTRS